MSRGMDHMPATALILAAGMGTRLATFGRSAPKGFLKLGDKPIIVESLEKLSSAGMSEIIIVTGHLRSFYDDLAAAWPASRDKPGCSIVTVHNAEYASSGSMYSLYKAREAILARDGARTGATALSRPFLLLESDLVYEARALEAAMTHPAESVVLLSGQTNSGDEVWADAPEGNLKRLSKQLEELSGPPAGELVGISKIGPELFAVMLEEAERLFYESLKVEYETVLTAAAARVPVPCHLILDLVWAEIDDESHLARARHHVYPRL